MKLPKSHPIPSLVIFIILGSLPARGIPFTLDFGGLQNNEQVLNFYNGGTGSLGSGPGPNFGITFSSSFGAVSAVPPYGPNIVGQLNGSSAIMDVSGGFNLLSFYYEASDNSGSVVLWSGLNGTGVMLADIPLAASATWNAAGTGFGPIAESAVFSGTPGIRFDQITDVALVTPEPSSILLFATGLISLIPACRRRLVG
jgi:hypothetical protein